MRVRRGMNMNIVESSWMAEKKVNKKVELWRKFEMCEE